MLMHGTVGSGHANFVTLPVPAYTIPRGVTNLTNNSASDQKPRWSPDGSRIAFESERDGNWEIYVMDEDGGNQTRLTNNGGSDAWPRWNDDGSRIAFQSNRDGNWEIYVVDVSASGGAAADRARLLSARLELVPKLKP